MCLYGILLLNFSCKQRDEHEGHYTDLTKNDNLDSLLGELSASTNTTVISSQPVVKVAVSNQNSIIKLSGIIGFDERRTNTVAAKIPGRIEEIFVRYNYQFVKKGQAVFSIYSPELITYMEQYLLLFKSAKDAKMLKLTKEKLLLLGVSESQIKQIEKQGKPLNKVVFYSPYEGFIRFGNWANAQPQTVKNMQADGMSGMGETGNSPRQNINSDSELQPGTYVQEGQTIFSVNDMKQVWALLSVPADNFPQIKTGTPVTVHIEGFAEKINGKIDFIEPAFGVDDRFGRVRVYLPNDNNKLNINSLVSAEVKAFSGQGIYVPVSSVYSLGRQKIVWLKTGTQNGQNIFRAKQVTTGTEANGKIQVISGLNAGDEIAENAAYLVDREGLIRLSE